MAYINKNIAINVIQSGKYSFDCSRFDNYRDNKEVVMIAFEKDRKVVVYESISDRLKNDRDVVLKAFSNCGNLYYSVPKQFADDKEVILTAAKQNSFAFNWVSSEIKNDKDFVMKLIEENPFIASYISDELKNDREVALKAIKEISVNNFAEKKSEVYSVFKDGLLKNKDFVNEAIKIDGYIFKYASEEIRNDKEVVLEAIRKYPLNKEQIGSDLKKEIGNNEPEKFISSKLLSGDLKENLSNKPIGKKMVVKI